MSSTAGVGRNSYNQIVARGRMASVAAREALRRIINETPGPQTTAMLIAKAALELGIIDEALTEFDQIGRKAKNLQN